MVSLGVKVLLTTSLKLQPWPVNVLFGTNPVVQDNAAYADTGTSMRVFTRAGMNAFQHRPRQFSPAEPALMK
jgi:hypothetical protein